MKFTRTFEVEKFVCDFYIEHGFDPSHPPGIYQVCFRVWSGGGTFRYDEPPSDRARITGFGWDLAMPRGLPQMHINLRIARALALWAVERVDTEVMADEETLSHLVAAFIAPLPAVRHDVLNDGCGPVDIARIYSLPIEVAHRRVRRVYEHESGERPSVKAFAPDDDTVLKRLV